MFSLQLSCRILLGRIARVRPASLQVLRQPLEDKVDIYKAPRVPASREKLVGERLGKPSAAVAARVEAARERQRRRFASQDSRVARGTDTQSRSLI